MNNILEFESVYKSYQDVNNKTVALEDVNLTLKSGEYLAIVGPSGAGKSTLLHIMGGLDKPSRGEVSFGGEDIFSLSDQRVSLWRNKHVGFIFQFYHLIEELSILENVALPRFLLKVSRKSSFKKAQKLLEYLDIADKINSVPSQLSGGQKQKVAVARALINDADLILCDEPTGSLDEDSASKVLNLIESLNKKDKKTVVIVTHDLELAKRSDRILTIRGGKLNKV